MPFPKLCVRCGRRFQPSSRFNYFCTDCLKKIREEKKFENVDELKIQIEKDIEEIKKITSIQN